VRSTTSDYGVRSLAFVRSSLESLLANGTVLLADGATGTNYFQIGLESGEPPELWNVDRPENVGALHQRFVDAGADIILTNTFGCNRNRLGLHHAEDRVFELAKAAAAIAREVADAADRPVVVAGSVGPTGELFAPLGGLTHETAVAAFREQIEGLIAGGANVAWIETMSAPEEVRAAATAAIELGIPYTATCSFDTAGRTMMGLLPSELGGVFDGLAVPPLAYGANCGVGAPDILVSLLQMTATDPAAVTVCKGNCGVPRFEGTEIVYTGTPALMGRYATLAVDAGARIVGGCCGTSPEHLAAMGAAIDGHVPGARPDVATIVAEVGRLANAAPFESRERKSRRNPVR
jgi:5-methyltetrahydrofolate--homocysteine methyltransferase